MSSNEIDTLLLVTVLHVVVRIPPGEQFFASYQGPIPTFLFFSKFKPTKRRGFKFQLNIWYLILVTKLLRIRISNLSALEKKLFGFVSGVSIGHEVEYPNSKIGYIAFI